MFLSTNFGESWEEIVTGLERITCLTTCNSNIFAGTKYNGLYKSTDQCKTWEELSIDVPNKNISSLYTNNSDIFAITSRGLFLSTDQGEVWNFINTGYSNTSFFSLLLYNSNIFYSFFGGVLFSKNYGEDWVLNNSGITCTEVRCLTI